MKRWTDENRRRAREIATMIYDGDERTEALDEIERVFTQGGPVELPVTLVDWLRFSAGEYNPDPKTRCDDPDVIEDALRCAQRIFTELGEMVEDGQHDKAMRVIRVAGLRPYDGEWVGMFAPGVLAAAGDAR